MSEERVQKILARAGVDSRRNCEELIAEGRVTVNGKVIGLGDKADPQRDAIKVDGKRIQPRTRFRYLLLNKPRAVMSTRSDPEGRPTVMDHVPAAYRKALVPVGRLDFLTEGLLLLTDDGDLAQRVAHPRYGCTKTYEVKVKGTPNDKDLDKLRGGIRLFGKTTRPAEIEQRPAGGARSVAKSDNSWFTIELSEGKTRQIREMFDRIGHSVMKLRRVAIGPLHDPDLPLGAVRELSEKEVQLLRRASGGGGVGRGKGKAAGKETPGKAKPAKGKPVKARPAKDRPAKGKPAKGKPVKGRAAKSEPAPRKSAAGGPAPGRAEGASVKGGRAKRGPVKRGPVKRGPVKGGPVKGGPAKGGPARGGAGKGGATKGGPARGKGGAPGGAKPPGKKLSGGGRSGGGGRGGGRGGGPTGGGGR